MTAGPGPPSVSAMEGATLTQLALVIGVVFAVNLLPAFAPPTWALLVFFSIDFDLAPLPLVLGGAVAAASGRFLLANLTRRLRPRLSAARLERLDRAQNAVSSNRLRAAAGLGLFAVSPLPSGQLFVAAGLLSVPLLPLTLAFFLGRLVSYSLYLGAATLAERNLGAVMLDALGSPLGVMVQIALLIGLAVLAGGFRPSGRAGTRRPPPAPGPPAPGARP